MIQGKILTFNFSLTDMASPVISVGNFKPVNLFTRERATLNNQISVLHVVNALFSVVFAVLCAHLLTVALVIPASIFLDNLAGVSLVPSTAISGLGYANVIQLPTLLIIGQLFISVFFVLLAVPLLEFLRVLGDLLAIDSASTDKARMVMPVLGVFVFPKLAKWLRFHTFTTQFHNPIIP